MPAILTRDRSPAAGPSAHLTDKGKRFMRLLVFPDKVATPALRRPSNRVARRRGSCVSAASPTG